jgi:hypothetical protein
MVVPGVRIVEAWQFANQPNAFCHRIVTASVCMSGSDGMFGSMGEALFCNFNGTIIAHDRLAWEDGVQVKDATGCGIAAPTRVFGGAVAKAAE